MNWTYYEILRIPELMEKIESSKFQFEGDRKYVFVGCGSSYNLALIISQIVRKYGIESEVVTGGKVVSFDYIPQCDIGIFISRTGESTETVQSAKKFKSKGIKIIGICCESTSSLGAVCDEAYAFDFLHEESVVMTGSFVALLQFFIGKRDISEECSRIIERSQSIIKELDLKSFNHFVFLGFDEEYAISKESALKMQEMALQYVEFHEPLEYRHGPIARLSDTSLVVINSKDTLFERDLSKELRKHTKVIFLGKNGDIDIEYENGLETPLKLIFALLLAYNKAITEGYNPDSPDKLSKSVKIDTSY
ncbi:MAG TPA: SIS domain-containing protein [Fervidobacterium sp.]|nr:sugar isomerase [Fervidobacterium sp.]HOK87896.1 SIS domain-containing protein [Fervidobacterium sp.]HPP17900.1 SIS domain-containing protein [Fervidobacterium sp.]